MQKFVAQVFYNVQQKCTISTSKVLHNPHQQNADVITLVLHNKCSMVLHKLSKCSIELHKYNMTKCCGAQELHEHNVTRLPLRRRLRQFHSLEAPAAHGVPE